MKTTLHTRTIFTITLFFVAAVLHAADSPPQHPTPATSPAVAQSLHALTDASPAMRATAARALGRAKAREAVAPLLGLLRDDDQEVRVQALAALGAIGDPLAVRPVAMALHDARVPVRLQAVATLGALPDIDSLDALSGGLHDADPGVRRATVATLARRNHGESALFWLKDCLRDTDAGVRCSAVAALGTLPRDAGLDLLVAAFADPDARVVTLADAALAAHPLRDRVIETLIITGLRADTAAIRTHSLALLTTLTHQPLGPDPVAWIHWFNEHRTASHQGAPPDVAPPGHPAPRNK